MACTGEVPKRLLSSFNHKTITQNTETIHAILQGCKPPGSNLKTDAPHTFFLLLVLLQLCLLAPPSCASPVRGSGSGHPPLTRHPRALFSQDLRRSLETVMTVKGHITSVLTENTHPGRTSKLHCERYCDNGICKIIHIPGVYERRYCTCFPNYTGHQCHLRVIPLMMH